MLWEVVQPLFALELQALTIISALLLSLSALLLYVKSFLPRNAKRAASLERDEADDDRPVVRVLFGTQTGTAEKFSKQLVTKLTALYGEHAKCIAQDLEQYKHEVALPRERIVFFVMATYGDGEPTDSAQNFVQWLNDQSETSGADTVLQVSLKHLSVHLH
jgi:NADPH-ferrihemoprotein reductase